MDKIDDFFFMNVVNKLTQDEEKFQSSIFNIFTINANNTNNFNSLVLITRKIIDKIR